MDISYILNHLGEERENYFNAIAPPIIQTSNFAGKTVADMRAMFADELHTHLYTRGNNPTVEILRKKIAALAGAEDALVFGSGVAAVTAAIMANVKQGSHVVCVKKPYPWAYKLLNDYLSRFGVTVTFVDGTNVQNFIDATQPNTTVYYLESPNSFTFELQDVAAIAAEAKRRSIVSIIDNSYCTSIGQPVIKMGIDIEVHSATKYYGGHSDVVAGYLMGSREMVKRIFETEQMMTGSLLSPNDAWLMIRSLRTLPLRLERVGKTTDKVVDFMENHPQVNKVIYPFSRSFPQYELAQKQMQWCGGLFTAEIKVDTLEQAETFSNSLKNFLMAVSWGGHESLIMPACSWYKADDYRDKPIPFNTVRFYIGLEDEKFLIDDLKQAFEKIE
jgi:cystathionine beta-lyase/cystathionine gamma-synthase